MNLDADSFLVDERCRAHNKPLCQHCLPPRPVRTVVPETIRPLAADEARRYWYRYAGLRAIAIAAGEEDAAMTCTAYMNLILDSMEGTA